MCDECARYREERDEARASEEWLAFASIREERDEARAEQNALKGRLAAMVDLAEARGAAYDIANERIAECQRTIRTVFALITDWRDGNAHVGRPRSFVDQHFIDAIHEVQTHPATEVKITIEGQRGGTATFTHWSGAATKPEGS